MNKYSPSERLLEQVDKTYEFVEKATPEQVERYRIFRKNAKMLADDFIRMCPESRELSLALTHLEDAIMWAIESISRNEKGEE